MNNLLRDTNWGGVNSYKSLNSPAPLIKFKEVYKWKQQ